MHGSFVLSVASVLVISSTVIAIVCYDCDSLSDPHCSDNFDPKGVSQVNCSDTEVPEIYVINGAHKPATGCLTRYHENPSNPARHYIRRTCYFGNLTNVDEDCQKSDPILPFPKILSCEICEEDLCNTGGNGTTIPI